MNDRRRPSEVAVAVCMALTCSGVFAGPLQCMQRFKFKDFVISAWWGPDPSEENYRLYKEAGFNVLMTYRNRANPRHGPDYQLPDKELALAEKLGIPIMFDTYMLNETPWGGVKLDPAPQHPRHHPARPAELEWLQERYGKNPMLVGYLLGDNCGLHGYMVENAKYLLNTAPRLFPWMSTNPNVVGQAKAPMPLLSTQNYPFLYGANDPEPKKRMAFCSRLEVDRTNANRLNMALWPIFNCCGAVSPSQLRFQIFACVAYGAQGIWYFHYNDNIFDRRTEKPGRLYPTAKECNLYVAAIGPYVIGHRCVGVFHTGDAPRGAMRPGPGEIVEEMSDQLGLGALLTESDFLAGKKGPDRVIVFDKRTAKPSDTAPDVREISVRFAPTITKVVVVMREERKVFDLQGKHELKLKLRAGEGRLVLVR